MKRIFSASLFLTFQVSSVMSIICAEPIFHEDYQNIIVFENFILLNHHDPSSDIADEKLKTDIHEKRMSHDICTNIKKFESKIDLFISSMRLDAFKKTFDAVGFCEKADSMKQELKILRRLVEAQAACEILDRKLVIAERILKTMTEVSEILRIYHTSPEPGSGLIYAVTTIRIRVLSLLDYNGRLDVAMGEYEEKVRKLWRMITSTETAFQNLKLVSTYTATQFALTLNQAKLDVYDLIRQVPGYS